MTLAQLLLLLLVGPILLVTVTEGTTANSTNVTTTQAGTTFFPTTVADTNMTTNMTENITTAEITSTAPETTTTSTAITTPMDLCLNGGSYDGLACVCAELFYGPRCENIVDRLPLVKSLNTSVLVEVRITNMEYTESLNNKTSPEYKDFETQFKISMGTVYSSIQGYQDVQIIEIKNGSIIVDHEVIVEIEYKANINITEEYHEIFQRVVEEVMQAKADNCTEDNNLCFDYFYGSVSAVPPTEEDLCKKTITDPEYGMFYTQVITNQGLTCVSFCDPISPHYETCNGGRCVIQRSVGPQCYCPETDRFIYTSPKCRGKILQVALYGGLGGAAGVLLIIILIISIVLCKAKCVCCNKGHSQKISGRETGVSQKQVGEEPWNNRATLTGVNNGINIST